MQLLFASVWSDPITWATIVIAAFTVANVWVAIHQWKATHDNTTVTRTIFEGSHRPWLGIHSTECKQLRDEKTLVLIFEIKNYGAVPALDTMADFHSLRVGGHKVDVDLTEKGSGFAIFPGASKKRTIRVRAKYFDAVMNGAAKLEVDVLLTYTGLDGETHTTSDSRVYDPAVNALVLGRATAS